MRAAPAWLGTAPVETGLAQLGLDLPGLAPSPIKLLIGRSLALSVVRAQDIEHSKCSEYCTPSIENPKSRNTQISENTSSNNESICKLHVWTFMIIQLLNT